MEPGGEATLNHSRASKAANRSRRSVGHLLISPLVLFTTMAMLVACSDSTAPRPAEPTRTQAVETVPVGTQARIIGEDRTTTVATYRLPWVMQEGIVNPLLSDDPNQSLNAYVTPFGVEQFISAGLVSYVQSSAKTRDTFTKINKSMANTTSPLIPAQIDGVPVLAVSCPLTNSPTTLRMVIFQTSGGLVWLNMKNANTEEAAARSLLKSVAVTHPNKATNWFALGKSRSIPGAKGPRCETDAVKATLGVAKPL